MFGGANVIVLPLTLAYTAAVYFIFRGRVTDADGYGGEEQALVHLSTRLPVDVSTTQAGKAFDGVLSAIAVLSLVRDFIRLPRRPRDLTRRPK